MREEGVRRILAVQELTCCVSTSIEAGATPASRSGVPLSSLALCSGLVRELRGSPGAAAPRPAGQPRDLPASPCPSLGRLRRDWAAPQGVEGRRQSPLRSPKPLSVRSSPQNGLEKRDFGRPVEGVDVICASKRS